MHRTELSAVPVHFKTSQQPNTPLFLQYLPPTFLLNDIRKPAVATLHLAFL
jgi:hypothetical protein